MAVDSWAARLAEALRDAREWGVRMFPDVTPEVLAGRVADEGRELEGAPWDREEAADVLILLVHWAEKAGVDLGEAVEVKMRVNRERKWNVRTLSHLREGVDDVRAAEGVEAGRIAGGN